ncbi:MAG: hypothetical protein MUF51_11875 [Vicinamibacteria bacterium]|nr:hypothetical protein [Vicinamibacteria bacterium]
MDETPRRGWREGPEDDAPSNSWLVLSDDDLLQRIETLAPNDEVDARLIEILQSERHFFIRQEAAKRIRRKHLLFAYEDDRHIGQILVRHLTRREDMTYLERLVARSQHSEVRSAAQVQLTRLKKKVFESANGQAVDSADQSLPGSWRIAVLHPEPSLRQMVIDTLPRPEFQVAGFEPCLDAPNEIEAFEPHLVMADVDEILVDSDLHQAIRRKAHYIPLVVMCPADTTEPLVDILGRGADEFLMLPVLPALLTAKIRALVHFAHRTAGHRARQADSGTIGKEGVLPHFRLCEEQCLTGRLLVTVGDRKLWVDFLDGEMTEAGSDPPQPDEESLAALLAISAGTYEITETNTAPQRAISKPSTAQPAAEPIFTPLPTGRDREEVDPTLLGWAIHFIVEQAWPYLGTTVTIGILRRTQTEMIEYYPALRSAVQTGGSHAHLGQGHHRLLGYGDSRGHRPGRADVLWNLVGLELAQARNRGHE